MKLPTYFIPIHRTWLSDTLRLFLTLLTVSIMSVSCQKMPVNGHLDGQWRVSSISFDGVEVPLDGTVFWNISLHVAQFIRDNDLKATANMIYNHDKSTLYFEVPADRYYPYSLRLCGIYSNPSSFHVDVLTRERLVVSDEEGVIVELYKF
ncbi:MAG: lipocalin-like domain-containing protein [Muribaculaceae bacterium]|nr:lipocalin-like domain-containing protein [Muribaculaceae bacterium]